MEVRREAMLFCGVFDGCGIVGLIATKRSLLIDHLLHTIRQVKEDVGVVKHWDKL